MRYILRSRVAKDNAIQAIANIAPSMDRPMEVVVRRFKLDKTAEQRGWFHKLCEIAAEHYHVPAWKIKQAVKMELFGYEVVEFGGKKIPVTRSSEDLDRKEYSQLIDKLYRMAADDGIVLPLTHREQAAYDGAVRR